MPSSDYTSAGGGLKLKGAKPTGIEKKRKKKSSSSKSTAAASSKDPTPAKDDTANPEATTELEQREKNKEQSLVPDDAKTEYERRHDETRRKRVSLTATEVGRLSGILTRSQLEEKLMREGVKTHKERVEELNKYLSTLSEHHDMPRIGPG